MNKVLISQKDISEKIKHDDITKLFFIIIKLRNLRLIIPIQIQIFLCELSIKHHHLNKCMCVATTLNYNAYCIKITKAITYINAWRQYSYHHGYHIYNKMAAIYISPWRSHKQLHGCNIHITIATTYTTPWLQYTYHHGYHIHNSMVAIYI